MNPKVLYSVIVHIGRVYICLNDKSCVLNRFDEMFLHQEESLHQWRCNGLLYVLLIYTPICNNDMKGICHNLPYLPIDHPHQNHSCGEMRLQSPISDTICIPSCRDLYVPPADTSNTRRQPGRSLHRLRVKSVCMALHSL